MFTKDMSVSVQPKILYYGTPVILMTTLNEDTTTNISPLSSSWALGRTLVLGLGASGKGLENLTRHGECVLNIPDGTMWKAVEALAPLTGKTPVPDNKVPLGFRYEPDKFAAAGLTQAFSVRVQPFRIAECPMQIEAVVRHIHWPDYISDFAIVEVEAVHVHAHESIILDDTHINPMAWKPLIYNFRHYFTTGQELGKTYRSET